MSIYERRRIEALRVILARGRVTAEELRGALKLESLQSAHHKLRSLEKRGLVAQAGTVDRKVGDLAWARIVKSPVFEVTEAGKAATDGA